MQHPYQELKLQNAALLAGAHILPAHQAQATGVARRLLASRPHYEAIEHLTTVRVIACAAIHERECDADFRCALCNGERIIGTDRKTTLVPRHRGPYATFEEGAVDAFHIDGLDKVAALPEGWTQERACYEWEVYNGMGPRAHGKHPGYVWAGTNVYDGGKYVRDGVWDPATWDQQLGCVAIMLAMVELAPDLALRRALPTVTAPTMVPAPLPVPLGHGGGEMSAADIQKALNDLGMQPPLVVDDSYGKITRMAVRSFQRAAHLEADGICGPSTTKALQSALATHGEKQ